MSAFHGRQTKGSTKRLRHLFTAGSAAASIALGLALAGPPIAAAQELKQAEMNELVDVAVDEARIIRVSRAPASVVIGNPLIADVLVEENGLMFLIGRNYGTTNLIAVDADGQEVASMDVVVRTGGRNAVSLFKGTGRVALNCSPRCETELDVGDSPEHFEAIRTQTESKTALSTTQAEVGQ